MILEKSMNEQQKKILFVSLSLFLFSIIYVPEMVVNNTMAISHGWNFIWDLSFEINLKVLLIEWVGIAVIGGGLFFYFKQK
jgi:hypothetical protein